MNSKTILFLMILAPLMEVWFLPFPYVVDEGWGWMYDNISEFHLFNHLTLLFHLAVFWPLSFAFMYLDLTKSPNFLYQYKIQTTKNHGWPSYKKAIKQALLSQFVALLFSYGVYFLFSMDILKAYGGMTCERELPWLGKVIGDLLFFVCMEEILFSSLHYMFHHKFLYKHIHALHHQFTAPIGMAAIYAHPVEHIIANMIPLILGPILMKSHIIEWWIWLTLGIINTITTHSGYEIPGMASAASHDYHHQSFIYNYGVLGIFDWIMSSARSRGNKLTKKAIIATKLCDK